MRFIMQFYIDSEIKNYHYAKRYAKFIQSRMILNEQRQLLKGQYEIHHIIPRSMGGTNKKDNLIKLSFREHFIAHVMLFYAYKNISMTSTIVYMTKRASLKSFNSRIYQSCREHALLELSLYKQANSTKGLKVHSDSFKNKMSKLMKGSNNSFYGKKHSNECRQIISEKALEHFQKNLPNCSKAVVINGNYFNNLVAAEKSGLFDVSRATIRRRILSQDEEWKEWKYA